VPAKIIFLHISPRRPGDPKPHVTPHKAGRISTLQIPPLSQCPETLLGLPDAFFVDYFQKVVNKKETAPGSLLKIIQNEF
jgi:hypothetical protein